MKFLALEYDTYTSHHKEPRPAIFIKTKAPANLVLTSSDEELQKIMRYFMLDETKVVPIMFAISKKSLRIYEIS